ncbi:MAG: hypothetical protein HZA03_08645 [Nitrospinae bacterium]|nr:hypothetical protein [Nitrospinota bacterium]
MVKNKLVVHTHHIGSHFTNGLMPVAVLLLTLYFITGIQSFETASFYCIVFAMIASPPVFFSGLIDWLTRFQGRSASIFNHKRLFGVLFMLVSILLVVWRLMRPEVAAPASELRYVYFAMVCADTGFVVYLGYLGGKFI